MRYLNGPMVLKELRDFLKDNHTKEFYFAVAYVNWLGLSQIWSELKGAINRRVKGTFVVGVSNGVTTIEAIRALLTLRIRLIGIDTGSTSAIFHPKVYEFYRTVTPSQVAFIGSSNLTVSGLCMNEEANLFYEAGPEICKSIVSGLDHSTHPMAKFASKIDKEWLKNNQDRLSPEAIGNKEFRKNHGNAPNTPRYSPSLNLRRVSHPNPIVVKFVSDPHGGMLILQLTQWDASHGEIVMPMGAIQDFFGITKRAKTQKKKILARDVTSGATEELSLDWRSDSGNFRLSSTTVRSQAAKKDIFVLQREKLGSWIFELVPPTMFHYQELLKVCNRRASGCRGKLWGTASTEAE